MTSMGGMKRNNPNLLSVGVLAAFLGVSSRDLRHEVEKGRLPHVRVGQKGILLDVRVVERILSERAGAIEPHAEDDGAG